MKPHTMHFKYVYNKNMNFQLYMTKKTEMVDEAGEPPTDHGRPCQKGPEVPCKLTKTVTGDVKH